jgi:hypothetical protein
MIAELLGVLVCAVAARRLVRPAADPRPVCSCGRPTWQTNSDGQAECTTCRAERLNVRSR